MATFVDRRLQRVRDLNVRARNVGMSGAELSRAAGYGRNYWSKALDEGCPDDALDHIEALIAERERTVLADLLAIHWERG